MKKGIILVPYMTGKGGTETVIHNLFLATNNNKNYSLKVCSIGGTTDYLWTKDVDIDIQNISSSRKLRTLYYATCLPSKIYKIISTEQPNFIISTNPIMWFLAKKCVNHLKKDIPIIAWYHYSLNQKPVKPFILKSADYYLAISTGIKKQLVSLGIKKEKVFLVFNPIVSDHKIINRPKDKAHFIYLGRVDLDGQKNIRELIDSLVNLHGEWVLDIYGDDQKAGPVKKYIEEKDIIDHIKWKGFVNDPWHSIKEATALVLTSKYEGLPMVLCEAISHGVYCISSDIATGPSDIVNNKNGKLYQPGNIPQLNSILQKIVNNPNTLPKQKDIITTSNKFSLDNYRNYFNNALTSILK